MFIVILILNGLSLIPFFSTWFVVIKLMLYSSVWFIVYISLQKTNCIFFVAYIGLVLSTDFVITCWVRDSSLLLLVPPTGFLSMLGPGFCCTGGSGTAGTGASGACKSELRPEAHSQSLLSSNESESMWLSCITGRPFTSTMVLRTLSYVVRGLMFRRFAGPQSEVGWHRSRTLWNIDFIYVATLKAFSAGLLF
jgi:hypothetical protein